MKTSTILHRGRWLAVAAAATVLFGSLAGWAAKKDKKTEPAEPDDDVPAAKPDSVRIFIQTVPPRKATVKWGPKSLGPIPVPRALVLERPRDSGPLDLVIHAAGFLPVHTRAYTFSDSRVAVKLTPPSEKNKLFGYREEPPPSPDAGAPAEPAAPGPPAAAPVTPPAKPAGPPVPPPAKPAAPPVPPPAK